jgi:L-lactate dehydrogenase complex protein LldG
MTGPLERFAKKMSASMGRVHEVSAITEVPEKAIDIAVSLDLEAHAVAASISDFRDLDWGKLEVEFRSAEVSDNLGVSVANFGIAETGTLVFAATPETPASLNFVPEFSIAVLRQADILEKSEDVWASLAKAGGLPHTVHLISGPSKTGDIEQTLFLGAHGPRELHVIIVKS